VTWTARASNQNWDGLAMSADGTKIAAAVQNGQIYTSIDSGVTWTASESNRSWQGIAISPDGTKLAAVVYGGQIYTSGCAAAEEEGGSTCGAGGVSVGGYCWYASEHAQSCNQACASHGGCNLTGTRDYAGSGGTNTQCKAVLDALALGSGSVASDAVLAVGCAADEGGTRVRKTSPTTTCAATSLGLFRACACNN
jgi:hypothetical protein